VVRDPNREHAFWETSMSSKKQNPTITGTNPQTRKIGSRVRCTDDQVEGRIVWANAVSVKIRWTDGEQVTWRRDSLASRPIEILEPSDDEQEHAAACASEQVATALPVDLTSTAPIVTEESTEPTLAEPPESAEAGACEQNPGEGVQAEEAPTTEPVQETLAQPEQTEEQL
jgi:hypothetical protein